MDKFVERVMAQLPEVLPDENDRWKLVCGAQQLYNDGFTVADAIKFLRCMEEVNPELSEDVALARMEQIRAKYSKE